MMISDSNVAGMPVVLGVGVMAVVATFYTRAGEASRLPGLLGAGLLALVADRYTKTNRANSASVRSVAEVKPVAVEGKVYDLPADQGDGASDDEVVFLSPKSFSDHPASPTAPPDFSLDAEPCVWTCVRRSRRESSMITACGKPPCDEAGVRHVYFDFDQTVTRIHVFKQLAGWGAGVSAPHSQCERGQIHRLDELRSTGEIWTYCTDTGTVVKNATGASDGCYWTAAALGGKARVSKLKEMFSSLKDAGVKLSIITEGNVGATRYLLDQEGMLGSFEMVFGMVGNSYGTSDYDLEHTAPWPLYEATVDNKLWGAKWELIEWLMSEVGAEEHECVLVEDDPNEIDSVDGLCRGLYVSECRGMTMDEMDKLLEMVVW